MNDVRAAINQAIRGITAVTSLTTAGRVYPAELAAVQNPTYPCVNFSVQASAGTSDFVDYRNVRMVIYTWSAKGYDECHVMMEAIKLGLHRQRLSYGSVNIVPQVSSDSLETYDAAAHAHGVITNWRVKGVG